MKFVYIIMTELAVQVLTGQNDYRFFPNLPTGKYNLFFKATFMCNHIQDSDLQLNLNLNKISRNTTAIKGNLTYKIPLDDSLTFNLNMAVKDSIGGWKDNAFSYITPKACSTFKYFMGAEWPNYLKSFGINDTNCPISPGVYISNGYDLSRIATNANFPKVFFYGTYKFRKSYTNKNGKEYGCIGYIIEIKRPWELE